MVQAELFLEIFSSDRMHMYNPVTDEWSEQPPPYACILPSKSNLMEYMTIDQEDLESRLTTDRDSKNPFGNVFSLPELERFFGIDPSNRHIDEVT